MDSDPNNDMTVPAPQEPPSGGGYEPLSGQVVDVPSYSSEPLQGEPVMQQEVPNYPQSEYNPPPAKKDNKKVWIIVLIVVAVLCCCCIVVAVAASRMFENMNIDDLDDFLNEFSSLIRLVPAFI